MESYCGCLTLNEDDDPIVPLMDSDSTLEVCLELPKHISEPYVYAQMAVLYPLMMNMNMMNTHNV